MEATGALNVPLPLMMLVTEGGLTCVLHNIVKPVTVPREIR
jgi:hypothetical protein